MANNKMLIDASHPEETRVVVVRGNRIEEFDFEAQERRQLRGNIYLAKVTRVEPSLQAAFIDYGGNRHGFLAFSEIHPDYYQIPAADRQALLEAEAAAAAAEAEEAERGEAVSDDSEEDDGEGGRSRRSRRRSRRGSRRRSRDRSAAEDGDSEDEDFEEAGDASEDAEDGDEAEEAGSFDDGDDSDDDVEDDDPEDEDGDEDDGTAGPRVMAAMVETDSISEPAPEAEDNADSDGETGDAGGSSDEGEKPKRKRRAPRKKKAAETADETGDAVVASDGEEASVGEVASDGKAEGTPKKPRRSRRKKAEASDDNGGDEEAAAAATESSTSDDDGADDAAGDEDAKEAPAKKPATRSRRGRGRSKSADAKSDDQSEAKQGEADDEDPDGEYGGRDGENGNGGKVESLGQEDALEEARPRARPRRQYKIQEVIRRRQVMLVQVVKEERGNKGAALTTYLSLAGRYSVLMPNTARGGGISRKITNAPDRKRLKEIASSLEVPQGMGVILRTAGASRTPQEIKRDFEYLMRLWENVRNLTLESTAPFLVYEEGSLIKRSIRDLYDKDTGEIIVSGEEGYREAKEFMRMLMPSHAKNVKLYREDQPLLSRFGVEAQLDKMLAPQVTLKSGGYLVINQTEALVAIDVNSGRSTREHSIEATALQTNLEAAEEVARQLRLRDLAGLIVIDFIDMEEKRNNRSVERKLKECLKRDRARIQVGHISHFGLLEMSRQRIRASVLESTMAPCPHCGGLGHVRSDSSLAIHILRSIEEHLQRHSRFDVNVRASNAAVLYIFNHKRQAVSELEGRYGVRIAFEADPDIVSQEFFIEKGAPASGDRRIQRPVSPMAGDEEAEDETETDGETEAVESSDEREEDRDGERGSGRRKRRRRRGRGGRGDEERESRSAGDDAAGDADADDGEGEGEGDDAGALDSTRDDAGDQDDGEEVADKAASGGRRGRGRSTRSDKEDAAPAKAAEEPLSRDASNSGDDSSDEDTPSRLRRRTGRPGKKARSESEAAASAETGGSPAGDEGDTTPRKGAPPRETTRRNTRRVKGAAAGSEAANGAEPDDGDGAHAEAGEALADIAPASASETVADTSGEGEEATATAGDDANSAEEKPKGGWGGFFS